MTTLQADIEGRLAASEPEVEVLLAEVVGGRRLRVFIDHPQGVTLGLCERVSLALNELRERYSLEVSSPGAERPLTKPAHFRRFVGRRVRVRTRTPVTGPARRQAPAGSRPLRKVPAAEPAIANARTAQADTGPAHVAGPTGATGAAKSFTGELVGASEREVTLAADGGVIAIPYTEIRRSNLVEE
jgi:ribosome maturation factor RimP